DDRRRGAREPLPQRADARRLARHDGPRSLIASVARGREGVAELALELERVVKRWRSGAALRGVDLAVPRGAVVGLVGPSGAGKTTAMRVGLGLLAPDEGTARVFSTPARAIALHRGRVGVLIDGPALEPALSVVDNLQVHALRHGRAAPDPAPWFEKLGLGGLARRR